MGVGVKPEQRYKKTPPPFAESVCFVGDFSSPRGLGGVLPGTIAMRRGREWTISVHYAAIGEANAAIGLGGKFFVVGHDDEGLVQFAAQTEEEGLQFGAVVRVERTGGLIGEDNVGTVGEGARGGHALLFTAREFGGFVLGARREPHEVEQFGRTVGGGALALSRNEGRQHHILQGGELGQELVELKDEADVLISEAREGGIAQARYVGIGQGDGTLVGAQQSAHHLEQGGLAGTRSADDAHHFAAGDVGVDAFEHFESAKRFVDVADGEDGHGEEFWGMTKEGEEDRVLPFSGRRG